MKEKKPILISRDEAMSPRVDDLVRRQESMRGESRGRGPVKRVWYYQNWFVFMVSGMLAALVAWGILEPWFRDHLSAEGVVMSLETVEEVDGYSFGFPLHQATLDSGQVVYLLPQTVVKGKSTQSNFSPELLDLGQKATFYVEYTGETAFANIVMKDPPPRSEPLPDLDSQNWKSTLASLALFPLVAGMVGLFLGAVDGIICKLPKRALRSGMIGMAVGGLGGIFAGIAAGLIYSPLSNYALSQEGATVAGLSLFGFLLQTLGRGIAWALAGVCMGLGQGLALRSKKLTIYGLLGGVIGGLMGGLVFDPIDLLLLDGATSVSAHVSRAIGLGIIGLTVGAMIGVVELLSRDSWLQMIDGPLSGKEFLIHKDMMTVGSSPQSDIYLFNDDKVEFRHAYLRCVGEEVEIESYDKDHPVLVNERPVTSTRLRAGDQVAIGRTVFIYHQKRK